MSKQRILAEIRRTATANGGRPLGRERFAKETGISEGQWSGRYWARWSDAVKEAGFAPNQMNVLLDSETVLGQLAAFIKQIGHFPVSSEMRMKKRSDTTFPNEKVFERFGDKAHLAQALLDYCGRMDGLEDVATICHPFVKQASEQDDPRIDPDESATDDNAGTKEGYVYLALLKVGREKRYKIGNTVLVEQRTNQIALQLPGKLELIHAITTDDAYGIEGYWHKRFAKKWVNGEWFDLTGEDVRAFRRRKFM